MRLKPFDVSTSEGRSAERYRRAALSLLADAASKGCGLVLMVLTVALTLPYLGPTRFGIWATLASLVAMLGFLDLGLGNALINRVAAAEASGNPARVAGAVSGGLAVAALIATIATIILTLVAMWLPWGDLLQLAVGQEQLAEEARLGAVTFAAIFGLSIISGTVRSVFVGLQRAFETHIAACIGYLVSIVGLWLATEAKLDIPMLLVITFGVQTAAQLLMAAVLFRQNLLRPQSAFASAKLEWRALLSVGGLFLILQLGTMVGWGADSLLIAFTLGPAQVTVFSVAQRLFQFAALPLTMLSTPLWGAYASAAANDDRAFVHRTLRMNLAAVAVLGLVACSILAIVSAPLVEIWTNSAVEVPADLVLALALWTLTQALGSAIGVFLNGTGIVRPQVVAVLAFVCIGLPLKWLLLETYGLTAFVLGSMGTYLATHFIVHGLIFPVFATSAKRTLTRGCGGK